MKTIYTVGTYDDNAGCDWPEEFETIEAAISEFEYQASELKGMILNRNYRMDARSKAVKLYKETEDDDGDWEAELIKIYGEAKDWDDLRNDHPEAF